MIWIGSKSKRLTLKNVFLNISDCVITDISTPPWWKLVYSFFFFFFFTCESQPWILWFIIPTTIWQQVQNSSLRCPSCQKYWAANSECFAEIPNFLLHSFWKSLREVLLCWSASNHKLEKWKDIVFFIIIFSSFYSANFFSWFFVQFFCYFSC